jgi:hypothetical protein
MKSLLILVLLSLSFAAKANVELTCETKNENSTTTLTQEDGDFQVVTVTDVNGTAVQEITKLYPMGSAKNDVFETVYWGMVDRKFDLHVPDVLAAQTVLMYSTDEGKITDRFYFSNCVRP